jgi:hypothetical protein
MASDTSTSRLLALPDHCLLAVMQHCADDTRSVPSAATAHTRLQQAAVAALSSTAPKQLDQARADSLLLYLAKHGQHVRSLALHGQRFDVQLLQLPPSLTKLESLQLEGMRLQLQPGSDGTQGVLRAGLPLTRLELNECTLLDGGQGLAAALMQLPDLQHLGFERLYDKQRRGTFPTDVLTHLTKPTCLKLQDMECRNSCSSSDPSAALQPLQNLTRLADLELSRLYCCVAADNLSRADQLTRLVVSEQPFQPHALAGKTQLQHLTLERCSFAPDTGVAQLLSELQQLTQLTQLTHLDLYYSCRWFPEEDGPSPLPAAYASLTASSQLQHLDFHSNTLPSAAWQYMCPPGRTLPQLTHLDIGFVKEADRSSALPDTSTLVSCFPGLHTLRTNLPCTTAQLAPLQRLTGLHTLVVGAERADELEGVQTLCQLAGLQDLQLWGTRAAAEARFLQLTQLTGLTAFSFLQGVTGWELRWNPQVRGVRYAQQRQACRVQWLYCLCAYCGCSMIMEVLSTILCVGLHQRV